MRQDDFAVTVKGIGKQYVIAEKSRYLAIRDIFVKLLKLPINLAKGKKFKKKSTFWAAKDITFNVKPGEVVGIIGRNGAGKSTLLKILSRITDPTEGEITYKGKVASLLEVGTGFHPELTGRENVFLNGSILGMSKKEIASKFDEIVDFAGVREFIDMPVKRYSSGMQVRLAFSVAAHLESDIMIIDEVLAVGDAEFQRKCLGKMDEVTKGGERTVFFVSHDMGAIQRLCSKVIWLDKGRILRIGNTSEVVSEYIESSTKTVTNFSFENDHTKEVKITGIKVTDFKRELKSTFKIGDGFNVEIEFNVNTPMSIVNTAVILDSTSGYRLFSSDSTKHLSSELKPKEIGVYKINFTMPSSENVLINANTYLLRVSVGIPGARPTDSIEGIVINYIPNENNSNSNKNELLAVNSNWESYV
jgi:lipopolysaccharide transport system ATP-binding protein